MTGSSRSYAIGLAHYQMGGGWKSLLSVVIVYLLIVLAALGIFYYVDITSGSHHGLTREAITLVLVLQTVVLCLLGTARVSTAVRSDLTSQMIESHRLMPISSTDAILGYLLGPTAHTLVFFLLNTFFAYLFALIVGASVMDVSMGQAAILGFSLLLWSAAAVSTFVARYILFIGIGVAIFGGCTMGIYAAYYFLPALTMIATPFLGHTIYSFSPGTTVRSWEYFASFLLQALFFVVFFSGARRRYRGTFPTTLSVPAAVLFLFAWSAATICGLLSHDGARMVASDFHSGQMVASLMVAMILSLITVRTLVTVCRKPSPHKSAAVLVTLLLATMAVALIPLGTILREGSRGYAHVNTLVAVLCHMLIIYALFSMVKSLRTWLAMVIVLGLCAVLWAVPLFADAIWTMATATTVQPGQIEPRPELGALAGFSALGTFFNSWVATTPGPVLPGLVGQGVLAATLGGIAVLVQRYIAKKELTAAAPVTPAAAVSATS